MQPFVLRVYILFGLQQIESELPDHWKLRQRALEYRFAQMKFKISLTQVNV